MSACSRAPRTAYMGRNAIVLITRPCTWLLFQMKRRATKSVLLLHQAMQQRGEELAIGLGQRRNRPLVCSRGALIHPLETADALGCQIDQPPATVRRIDPHRHIATFQQPSHDV